MKHLLLFLITQKHGERYKTILVVHSWLSN